MLTRNKAIHSYGKIENEVKADSASPYELTKMLFAGALKSLAIAAVCIDNNKYEQTSKEISRSIGIINGLRDSLDLSQGELAENLYQLYSYFTLELLKANVDLDSERVRGVKKLLSEIDDAWNHIPISYRG